MEATRSLKFRKNDLARGENQLEQLNNYSDKIKEVKPFSQQMKSANLFPLKPTALEIFEDTVHSQNLKRQLKPCLFPFKSTTSAVRFTKNGLWKQALMNQVLKIGFHFHVPHAIMNRIYEKGLNLNSKR